MGLNLDAFAILYINYHYCCAELLPNSQNIKITILNKKDIYLNNQNAENLIWENKWQ